MSMPSWDEFMVPVLRALSDGEARQRRELMERTATTSGLTADQREERFTSGEQRYLNRIGWAQSYLDRIGAIERPSRGIYRITDLGRQLLKTYPVHIGEKNLRTFAREGDQWWVTKGAHTAPATAELAETPAVALDPTEQIEIGIAAIQAEVAAELLVRLQGKDSTFFEAAVVKLLVAMGYGGTDAQITVTQRSNDGGIDGIIDQDALGLDRVYIQAKRYATSNAVQRPELQAFVGALSGKAERGVFITTSRFSPGARGYSESIPTRIILIDGERLTRLMIAYGVGVQVESTYRVVKIDEDFFE